MITLRLEVRYNDDTLVEVYESTRNSAYQIINSNIFQDALLSLRMGETITITRKE